MIETLTELVDRVGPVMLDGELIAIDGKGKPLRFQALQSRGTAGAARTALVAFDCLAANGRSLTALPWTERRVALELLVPKSSRGLLRRGDSAPCGSKAAARILDAARKDDWEGLILKQMDSRYEGGKRSPLWRKVKLEHEQEFVIGGFTIPTEGVVREFGALLIGHYDDEGSLRYAGKVGTGYTQKTLATLGKQLTRLVQNASPFVDAPKGRGGETIWVEPRLVAQIKYNEMTDGGVLRQPSYLGLRDDKNPRFVRLEEDTSGAAILDALRCGADAAE